MYTRVAKVPVLNISFNQVVVYDVCEVESFLLTSIAQPLCESGLSISESAFVKLHIEFASFTKLKYHSEISFYKSIKNDNN